MRKIYLLLVVAISLLMLTPALTAAEPLGYPGYTWGDISYPSNVAAEKENLLFDGKIEQGIDWMALDSKKEYILNTFVDFRYTYTKKYPWNNQIGIGMKVRRIFPKAGIADIGVKLVHENRWKEDLSASGVQVFFNWYFDWDLKKGKKGG